MTTRQENEANEVEAMLRELAKSSKFLSEQCEEARLDGNHAMVRDLSSHIVRLEKERLHLAKEHGKLISLAEAKESFDRANDDLLDSIWEIAPDKAPAILAHYAEALGT